MTAGRRAGGRHTLTVYVEEDCFACVGARETAERARRELVQVEVEIVDLGDSVGEAPDAVFATPTFLLDGKVLSLGTPDWEALVDAVTARQRRS